MCRMHRNFNVRYFPDGNHVEILDVKSNKLFLKKTQCPAGVSLQDFFLGGKLLLFGRHFELTEYLDAFTATQLSKQAQKSILLFTHLGATGAVLTQLHHNHFTLSYLKLFLRGNVPTIVVEVVGESAVERLPLLVSSLQSRFGGSEPGFEVAATAADVQRLHDQFVAKAWSSPATFTNCTCCVIQPHVLKEGQTGAVVDAILDSGLTITAMELFNLDRTSASEFLERFREAAGPWDIDMAKELKPATIRARFGADRVHNAVHCTDLSEDGALESQYFFDILARK
ncbi:hypothetical protein DYB32_004545 [Aphanomyces invadans]|uniref:DM10 domain-containing protein n=1 Tax=Aphanomyces invadans TaxID=157072 RepID=A0A418AXC4_9STRA|nr:hypothetical protein DYB32_004545 [Aphanomyces invadans]